MRHSASVVYRFGDGRPVLAERRWDLPVWLGGFMYRVLVHEVTGGLPLLLSRPSLCAASAVLDVTADTLWLKD